MIEKEKVLSDAPKALNSDNNPWEVAVEGDSIIGTWKWMDARFSLRVESPMRTKSLLYSYFER